MRHSAPWAPWAYLTFLRTAIAVQLTLAMVFSAIMSNFFVTVNAGERGVMMRRVRASSLSLTQRFRRT
jgi:hypothetical protein